MLPLVHYSWAWVFPLISLYGVIYIAEKNPHLSVYTTREIPVGNQKSQPQVTAGLPTNRVSGVPPPTCHQSQSKW